MDTSPIPGFITRKEASQRSQRAERTLQRYWSRAIELRNTKVLEHLKLYTEDGTQHEGTTVTKELIEELKKKRQNPTWYVDAAWVETEYGINTQENPKSAEDDGNVSAQTVSTSEQPEQSSDRTYSTEYVELLREQIEELKNDKGAMRAQISQYDKTLDASNQLQQQLHVLLKEMQDRLLPAPKSANASATQSTVIDAEQSETNTGNERTKTAKPRPTQRSRGKKQSPRVTKKTETPNFFSFQTPTLRRIAEKVSRR